jgi:phage protein D
MPIEKQYSPEFKVEINGKPIPAALRGSVSSVTFTTGLEGADRVEVAVANQALTWLDNDLLKLESPFKLAMGYLPEGVVPMFAGEITGVAASFPSSGLPQLTITAQDRRQRMQQGIQAKWHANPMPFFGNLPQTDQVLAEAVAGKYGLRVAWDPIGAGLAAVIGAAVAVATAADPDSAQKAVRRQVNESDYDFLRRVARENGLELRIEHPDPDGGKVLRMFSPLDHLTPDVDLEYHLTLIEFTPRESNVGQVAKVTTNIWVPATKQRFGVSLGLAGTPPGLSLEVSPNPAPPDNPKGVVVLDEPLTPATAPHRLVGELIPRLNERLTGSGSTIGNPLIRAGTVLRLAGLGERFGGLYRVKSATHTIDPGGYRTRFDVRKEIWLEGGSPVLQKNVKVRRPPAIKVPM